MRYMYISHYGNVAALPSPPKRLRSLFSFDSYLSHVLRLGCKQAVMQGTTETSTADAASEIEIEFIGSEIG